MPSRRRWRPPDKRNRPPVLPGTARPAISQVRQPAEIATPKDQTQDLAAAPIADLIADWLDG
jgi:hypothetical protein